MNKLNNRINRVLLMLVLIMSIGFNKLYASTTAVLTFQDDKIVETSAGSGYSINGNKLTITSSGTYRIKGSSSEGNIEVKKELTNVVLILDNLSLTSSKTAPILINKDASVTIKSEGVSTITDNENVDNKYSTNPELAVLFEGAGIKVKSGASVTFAGSGTLNVVNTSYNAIKGAENASLTFNSGTYNINGANHGIACDGNITFNGGNYTIDAYNEGIKIEPDEDEEVIYADLVINGGNFDITAGEDGIQVQGDIYINNWPNININSFEDGIQTRSNFYMTNGNINIHTYEGWNFTTFNETVMSAKGIKASPTDDITENATNMLRITGGTITIDASDDAIHSDGYIEITRGTLNLESGDDGIHADTKLTIGTEGGFERDPEVYVHHSYEGIEAGNIYIYSGRIKAAASDDGINAAGGASSGSGQASDNHYNPGNGEDLYALYIYGGNIYINAEGDGLDSNGSIYLYGGTIVSYHEDDSGDDSGLDRDAKLIIDGATVFTSGGVNLSGLVYDLGSSQKFVLDTASYPAGTKIAVVDNGVTIFNDQIPKGSIYTFYTSPSLTNDSQIIVPSTLLDPVKPSFSHTYDDGTITQVATPTTPGIITYTCTEHNREERKTYFYKDELTINVINKTNGVASVNVGGETDTSNFTVHTSDGVVNIISNNKIVLLTSSVGETNYEKLTGGVLNNAGSYNYQFNIDASVSQDLTVLLLGDMNEDGSVDNLDAELILKSKLSPTNNDYVALSELGIAVGDINEDGTVNIYDALAIKNNSEGNDDSVSEKFKLTNDESVLLDGDNDGYVTVDFKADKALNIDAIEAYFLPNDDNPESNTYFSLISLERVLSGGEETHDVSNGLIYLVNTTGYSVAKNDIIYRATFKVDKDTPTGNYPVRLRVQASVLHGSNEYSSFVLTDNVTVKGQNDPYIATFAGDEGVTSIDTYDTQEYGEPNGTDVTTAVVKNGSSGTPDMSGDGQVNFKVNLKSGYIISSITVSPTDKYKNIKGPSDTGQLNTYRVTKVSGDILITITTREATEYTATFVKGEGIESVDVYYTQDYTTPDEVNVDSAFVRNSDTGNVDLSGDGQVNFKINPAPGYKVLTPTVEGSYKNIKYQQNNIYRITKINGDIVVNLTAELRTVIAPTVSGVEDSYVYTGESIHPSVTLSVDDETINLVEGTDYVITYGENINVGTGSVTVKSVVTSNYNFSDIVVNFDITKYPLTESNIIAPSSVVYSGSTLSPEVLIVANNLILEEGTDYDITYDNLDGNIDEFITVTVTGKNNFSGTAQKQIQITDKIPQVISFEYNELTKTYGENYLSKATLSVGNGHITYSSSDPSVATIDQNGNVKLLKSGQTTITAVAASTSTYAEASTSYLLTVNKAPLSITSVKVSNKKYDGTTEATVIKVNLAGVVINDELLKGTDFSATGEFEDKEIGYDKDVNVTVTLTEDTKKRYSLQDNTFVGKAKITLEEINELDVSLDNNTFTYTGEKIEPNVTVVTYGKTLVKDTDYKVEYQDNIDAGTAKVLVSGLNNYFTEEPIVIEFTINKKSVTPEIAALSNQEYTGSEIEPALTVTSLNYNLVEGKDYEVEYSNNTDIGVANARIKPLDTGNFEFDDTSDNAKTTFNIVAYEIKSTDITLSYYFVKHDGTDKEPMVSVEANGKALTQGTDYEVEYSNNRDVTTTATVQVNGLSPNYTGSPKVYFEISSKDLLTISGINDNQTITYTGNKVKLAGTLSVSNNSENITPNDLTVKWYTESGSEIEHPTDTGKYYAVYSYSSDTYEGSLKVNFEITKKESKDPSEMTDNLSTAIGNKLSDVNLTSNGLSWVNSNTEVTEGKNNYEATYTQNGETRNYTTRTVNIPVTGKHKITINTSVDGIGGEISASISNVLEGEKKNITFTPEEGYEVDFVKVDNKIVSVSNNEITVTAKKTDMNVIVRFKTKKVKVTITGTNVNLSDSGIIYVNYDSNKTITITPKSGYTLSSVTVNGKESIDLLNGYELSLENIKSNTKVVAKAVKSTHSVTKGGGQTYTIHKNNEAPFEIDAEDSLFNEDLEVYVDNKLIDKSLYKINGKTVILSKSLLDDLSKGTHGLKVKFSDESSTSTTFVINIEPKPLNPKTNDNIIYMVLIFIFSVLFAFLLYRVIKLKKEY